MSADDDDDDLLLRRFQALKQSSRERTQAAVAKAVEPEQAEADDPEVSSTLPLPVVISRSNNHR